ncbi:hypothetical protein D3C77_480340 [compost metagenome]
MHASSPIVTVIAGRGVVEFSRRQRGAYLGFPAIATKGAGDPCVDLVALLVVLARLGEGDGVIVQVGITADFRRVANATWQHAREVAQLQVPVLVFVAVFEARTGADAIAHEKRNVVAPAELWVGLQAEGLERCADLQVGVGGEAVADIAAVDGTFAVILEPVTDIAEQLLVGSLYIDAEGIEEKAAIVFSGVPVFIPVVHPQGAADIQRALAVITAPGDMRKRLLHRWRLVGGGRAGFGGETCATAEDQAQAYHVLVHIYALQG